MYCVPSTSRPPDFYCDDARREADEFVFLATRTFVVITESSNLQIMESSNSHTSCM